jgi:hypothetical protein
MALTPASPDLGTGPTNQQGPFPQPGSTTPTTQIIGPLPASTMPGQLAQTIPVMANFQFLLGQLNNLQTQINNITPPPVPMLNITATLPIIVMPTPITSAGVISHAVSGVVPGIYGGTTAVPQLTVEVDGHVTKVVNIPISGGGGFIQASYVVMFDDPGLTIDRILTQGTGITITDGGAKGPVTIAAGPPFISVVETPYFGDGRDGTVVLDGVNTFSWATLVGSTYTMVTAKAVMALNMTINSGIVLDSGTGQPIFVLGTLTNNGRIINNGVSAINNNGASAKNGNAGSWFNGGTMGQAGGNGSSLNGAPGGDSTLHNALGGGGGAGGASGTGHTGGAGGVADYTLNQDIRYQAVPWMLISPQFVSAGQTYPAGGSGGGGGGGDGAFAGGGGGSGAGIVGVFANIIAGTGTIEVVGGNGFSVSNGNAGGGGGGGGGNIRVITTTANWQSLWTVKLNGGLGGTAHGSGVAGGNGGAGSLLQFIVG